MESQKSSPSAFGGHTILIGFAKALVTSSPKRKYGLSVGTKMVKPVQDIQVARTKYEGCRLIVEPVQPKYSYTTLFLQVSASDS